VFVFSCSVDLLPVSDGRRIGETVLRKGTEALHLGGARYVPVTFRVQAHNLFGLRLCAVMGWFHCLTIFITLFKYPPILK
jgi:hypothetical protein